MLRSEVLASSEGFFKLDSFSAKQVLPAAVQKAVAGIEAILAKIQSGQLVELSSTQTNALRGLCQSLRSCARETNKDLLSQDLKGIALGLLNDSTFAPLGEAILQIVMDTQLPDWEAAEHCLAVHRGTAGSFGEQLGKSLTSLFHTEKFIPMALGMAGASFIGKGVRVAASRLLSRTSLLSRGGKLALHATASTSGLFFEATAFPAVQAGANILMGQPFHLAHYDQQALGALKTIGGLRLAGRGAHWLRRGALGIQLKTLPSGLRIETPTRLGSLDLPSKILLPLGAELGTLTLLNAYERPGQVWAAHLSGALGTMAEFRAAGGLTQVFAPKLHLAHEALDRAAYDAVREVGYRSARGLWKNLNSGFNFIPWHGGREALTATSPGGVTFPSLATKSPAGLSATDLSVAKMSRSGDKKSSSLRWPWERNGPETQAPAKVAASLSPAKTVQLQIEGEAERLHGIYEQEIYFEAAATLVEGLLVSRRDHGSPHPYSPEFSAAMRALLFPSAKDLASAPPDSILAFMSLARPSVAVNIRDSHKGEAGVYYEIYTSPRRSVARPVPQHPGPVIIEGFPCEPGNNSFLIFPQTNQARFTLGRHFEINGQIFPGGAEITLDFLRRSVVKARDLTGLEIRLQPDPSKTHHDFYGRISNSFLGPRLVTPESIQVQFEAVVKREGFVPMTRKDGNGRQVLIKGLEELHDKEIAVYFSWPVDSETAQASPQLYNKLNRVVIGTVESINVNGQLRIRLANGENIDGSWLVTNRDPQRPVYVKL